MKPVVIWLRFELKKIVRNLFCSFNVFEKKPFAQYYLN